MRKCGEQAADFPEVYNQKIARRACGAEDGLDIVYIPSTGAGDLGTLLGNPGIEGVMPAKGSVCTDD